MSSETFSHQVPINGTIQTKVLPGNQTNLYYILVSNLPWQTSWQQLKDHVRTVATAERVEVFNESTSGWVLVRGRENFDAALRLLDGGVFNGRPLFAEGKNATESIMIREPVGTSTTNGSASSRTPQTPRYKTSPSTQYSASTPPLLCSPVPTSYGEWTSPTSNSSYATASTTYSMPVTMPYDYNDAPSCFAYDTSGGSYVDQTAMVSSPTMVQYPFETGYPQQCQVGEYQNNAYAMYSTMPAPLAKTTRMGDSSNAMVPTRQRKIIIKQLQPWVNFHQVHDLIRKKAGSEADKVQHIDLPLTDSQESNRGYALITFQSEEAANKLIRRLNGCKFEGRELKADYTKEGVSENETSRSRTSGHKEHKERRDDREKREKRDSTRGSNSNEKKSKSHKSTVVIADGSSPTSSRRSDPKEKPSKRH